MLKKEESLLDKTLIKARASRKLYLPFYFMAIILILTVVWILYNELEFNLLVIILVLLFVVVGTKYTELHRLNNLYKVIPGRLVHVSGLINKTIKKVDFFAISDLDIQQSAWQRLLHFGDINVRLFSKDSTTSIRNINNPEFFADFLEEEIMKTRKQVGGRGDPNTKND